MARVLLIDDDRDQLEMRKLILEHHGHVALTADSPAAVCLSEQAPDVVVMDLRLPAAEDGLALIRTIRAGFEGRILVLSGFPKDIEGKPEAALVDRILEKPVRSETLIALIHQSRD